MTKKIVNVQFIYEGVSIPTENRKGVLLPDNKVLISDNEGLGIYAAQPTEDSNKFIVDLDTNDTDFLTNPEMILDLIVA